MQQPQEENVHYIHWTITIIIIIILLLLWWLRPWSNIESPDITTLENDVQDIDSRLSSIATKIKDFADIDHEHAQQITTTTTTPTLNETQTTSQPVYVTYKEGEGTYLSGKTFNVSVDDETIEISSENRLRISQDYIDEVKEDILDDIDTNTQLTEAEVDTYVANNGYLTSYSETDPTVLVSVKDGVDISEVTNGSGLYLDYKPNNTACNPGEVLKYDTTNGWICGVDEMGVTIPAGNTGEIQFNNAGNFAANSDLFWDDNNGRLGVGTSQPESDLHISNENNADLLIEGQGTIPAIVSFKDDRENHWVLGLDKRDIGINGMTFWHYDGTSWYNRLNIKDSGETLIGSQWDHETWTIVKSVSDNTALRVLQYGDGDFLQVGNDLLTVANNGNVGIGTDTAVGKLTVNGGIATKVEEVALGAGESNLLYDITTDSSVVIVDTSASNGSVDLYLPALADAYDSVNGIGLQLTIRHHVTGGTVTMYSEGSPIGNVPDDTTIVMQAYSNGWIEL